MRTKKIFAALITLALIISNVGFAAVQADEPDIYTNPSVNDSENLKYNQYIELYKGYSTEVKDIVLSADEVTALIKNAKIDNCSDEDKDTAIFIDDQSACEWTFDIPENGLYQIEIEYMSVLENSGVLENVIKIDREIPFKEATYISLSKCWEDGGEATYDLDGNQQKPTATEVKKWLKSYAKDPSGYLQKPFSFAFKAGSHTITLEGRSGTTAIKSVTLKKAEQLESYEQIVKKYKNENIKSAADTKPIIVEGENYKYKSDVTIYPISDSTSPTTFPQSASLIILNTVGGTKWKGQGQWITWEFEVENSGLYKITPRFKQSFVDGIYVSRALKIDGEYPFEEAKSLQFNYNSKWQISPLGNSKTDFEFYFEKGKHEISLEVCLGDVGEYLGEISESITILNAVYRDILMITGSVPDTERDYGFERLIPDTIKTIQTEHERLSRVVDMVVKQSGRSSYTSILNKLIFQLEKMHSNPRDIAKNLVQFKSNLGSMATWLLTAMEQPLQIDRFYISPSETKLDVKEDNVFSKLLFGIKCFLVSFSKNYNNIGQSVEISGDNTVSVWIQTGRDQAQILRQIADNDFSVKKNIRVEIKLVAGGSLLPSILAKTGPDVALDNGKSDPINYAIRNANYDLTQFEDFEEISKWFYPSTIQPYTIDGKVFALPQTLNFPMFFYRTDIFKQLKIETPKTFDELISIIPILQRNNMSMAFPTNINGFALLLYQNGGEFYVDNGVSSNLTSDITLESFQQFTEMYTLWGLPTEYDFANRFRTGEMPCGIQDYTFYNNLSVFAPEIKGLWEFIPVPGKMDENGNIDNISIADGTNVMIMNNTKNPKAAWEFVKWWLSAEVQTRYAIEMESVLGAAGKQPTANAEAIKNLSWTSNEAAQITAQLKALRTVPEVPGGYYTSRVVDFAFSKVYNRGDNPVEAIENYVDELNEELTRKRAEFGY